MFLKECCESFLMEVRFSLLELLQNVSAGIYPDHADSKFAKCDCKRKPYVAKTDDCNSLYCHFTTLPELKGCENIDKFAVSVYGNNVVKTAFRKTTLPNFFVKACKNFRWTF